MNEDALKSKQNMNFICLFLIINEENGVIIQKMKIY